MLKKSALTIAASIPLLFAPLSAQAAQLKVMVSGAMAHALQEIATDFAKKNGHTLDFIVGTTGVFQDRVRKGEKVDVIEVTNVGMDALEKEKLVTPGTRADLASALIGVAVRDGAPVPDISTIDALKARLVAAKSVAWIDPKIGGQAGAAIVSLLQKMGIADEVAKKSVYGKTGADAVQKMAAGEADIAISFVSEIKPIKGAKLVGPLPAPVQNPSTYSGAIGPGAPNRTRPARCWPRCAARRLRMSIGTQGWSLSRRNKELPMTAIAKHTRIAFVLLALAAMAGPASAAEFTLMPTPQTVNIGNFNAANRPALTINSGDIVTLEAATQLEPEAIDASGVVPPSAVPQYVRDIYRDVKDRGPGPHVLTGPIYVNGAMPGDVLEVRILAVDLAADYAYNRQRPYTGALPEEFTQVWQRVIPINRAPRRPPRSRPAWWCRSIVRSSARWALRPRS